MAHEANVTPTARKISNNNLRCLNWNGQVIECFDQQLYQGIKTGGKSGGKVRNNMQLDIYWLPHTHAASVQQLLLLHHRSSE
ncbi:hypothetical protein BPAE_0234g00040 [Botrytis paeoniae]|uniref:Uncharacterized protein n=1 Tax=Botrytis paeoniae TaxID=278948 RepID=A0A4Z1FEI2_9HELO|nr:hypothetical protein BPAE_0234g00040 [Botrytis paeoniae]